MKIYLAGPMRGHPKLNFPAFNTAAKKLRKLGFKVFNPAEKGKEKTVMKNPSLQENLKFRREVFCMDLTYICKHADAVVLLPGWKKSLGAKAERATALAIGIEVIPYATLVN